MFIGVRLSLSHFITVLIILNYLIHPGYIYLQLWLNTRTESLRFI